MIAEVIYVLQQSIALIYLIGISRKLNIFSLDFSIYLGSFLYLLLIFLFQFIFTFSSQWSSVDASTKN